MKIAIHSNNLDMSVALAETLKSRLKDTSFVFDSSTPDVVVSIGGDGTMLSAFHKYEHLLETTRFVAVHTGHLGFYTDFVAQQIDDLIVFLKNVAHYGDVSYPLLSVQYSDKNGQHDQLALNEMTLKTISGTLVCEVYINDDLFEVFRGDGICLSTPTGSTAISKSLGGAVLHPGLDAMQLTEMTALNNTVYRTIGSPLILPASDRVKLVIKRAITPVMVIDNFEPYFIDMENTKEIVITLSHQRVYFKDFKNIDFWKRVESAFIGEIDREALSVKPTRRKYNFVKLEK
ncbi:NAD kinase [Carnobacteriaceae bacterium zg-ZUI252]|nr:NAD kinase [Carnobacteriaceae bacterium zg-ZUI252]